MSKSLYCFFGAVFLVFILNSKIYACSGTTTFTVPGSSCVGSKVSFTFSTTGATVDSFRVVFGDGKDSLKNSASTIDHVYSASGTYYVSLIRSLSGCKDTLYDTIIIYNKPSATFNILYDSICSGQIDSFTYSTSGLTYSWSFSTGSSSTNQNVGISFTNSGSTPINANAKFIVSNSNGCKDSSVKSFVIMPLPTPSFSFNNDSSCSGSTISFTNSSTNANSYIWYFGDGQNSNNSNPSHIYSYFGNGYSSSICKLIAITNFGCKDSISKTIRSKQKPDGSIADYNNTPTYTYCSAGNFDLQVDDSSTTSSSDSTHFFNWGDGGADTVLNFGGSNITHTYTTKGYFTLSVKTIGKNQCTNIKTYIVFNGGNPSVGLASPGGTTGLCAPATLKFPLTSVSGNPAGTIYTVTSNDGGSTQTYSHPPPDTIVWTFSNSSCGYTSQGGFNNSFHIKITAQNPCGTSQATVEPITVNKSPKADYTISPNDTICKNDIITFTDNTTAGNYISGSSCSNTYKRFWQINPTTNWDSVSSTKLGNPTTWYNNSAATSGSSALQIKFKDTGVYQIKLMVANPLLTCGSDTIAKNIYVIDPPVAKFTPKLDSGCINLTDTFLNQSTGLGNTYKWSVSPSSGFTYQNGTSDTSTNPILRFTTAGIYIITLTATNPCSTSVYIDTIVVKSKPKVTITSIPNGCKSYSISPTATYNSNNSTISSYSWTFSGGSPGSSSSQNPGSINYTSAGTYTVIARATNECGTDSSTDTFTVFAPPTINIGKSVDTICINSGNYTLSGYSPSGGVWSGTAVSSGGVFNPSSSGSGTFSLKYIYTDGNGCKDSASKSIKVIDKPTVKFSFTNRCKDSAISFKDSSTTPAGSISSRTWYFGDGNTSTSTNPTHTYSTSGTFNVKLIVYNSFGCYDSLTQTVTVYPKPQVAYTVNDTLQCISGNSFVFTNGTTISSGSISSYKWTFGDTSTSTSTNPTHSYIDTGSYITKLIVKSDKGCVDSLSKTMKVLNGPSVNFTINDTNQCLTGNSFTFTSTSTANGGTITNYDWTFGNGNTSTVASPSAQSYSSSGSYSVKLIITNSKGCKDSLTKTISIYSNPAPSFSFGSSSFCAPYSAKVSNTTSATPVINTWKWSIVGSSGVTISNDTAKEPTFVFPDNQTSSDSTYNVKLIATSINGCIDSSISSITIKKRPKVLYTTGNDSCGPVVINISNSSINVSSYSWTVSPSASISNSTIAQPVITLPRNQTGSHINYIIKCVATSSSSCNDSLSDTVKVYTDPLSKFSVTNTDSCGPFRVYFTNTSTPSAGSTYIWDFGNGITSTSKDTNIYYYNNSGIDSAYPIKLITKSSLGCYDDTIRTINVKPNAKAIFTASNTSGCAPFVINTSVISTQTFSSANSTYKWYANNSLIGTGSSFPGYTINNANDSIIIKLVVTSAKGCKDDSIEVKFKTISNPTPSFNCSDTIGCNQLKVLFTNTSSPSGLSYQWEFGNNSNNSTQSDSVYYTFYNLGTSDTTWKVKLIAMAGAGCKDSIVKNIIVHPSSKPNFTIDSQYCAPISVVPNNITTSSPTINQWKWNLYSTTGSAFLYKTDTIKSPSYSFADNQTTLDSSFELYLISTTTNQCTDTFKKTFIIRSRPLAKYTVDSVCQLYANTFYDSSTFSSASGNIYHWNFGDGDSSSSISPTHTYPGSGTYFNKLTIRSLYNCIDTLTKPVVIHPKPTPAFSIPSSVCAPANISPNNTTASNPTINTWSWKVINGSTIYYISTVKSPTFSFADNQTGSDSTFTIKLTTTTSKGCIDSLGASIVIKTRPKTNFTADTASCAPDTFTVSNSSLYANSYIWSASPTSGVTINNNTSTTPTFTFGNYIDSVSKTYQIKNVSSTTSGCKDSLIQTYNLYPNPKTLFSLSQSDTCGPVSIKLINQSTPVNGLSYSWDFGNGSMSTTKDSTIVYYNGSVNDSIYKISLTTQNIYNCNSSFQDSIVIRPDAKAYYSCTDSISCAPYNINSSTITPIHYSNANNNYKWLVNGSQLGSTQTGSTLSFPGTTINNQNDSIFIQLVAFSKNGCKNDTIGKWFKTIQNPKPNFSRNDSVNCHPMQVNFTDSSSPSGGLNYIWNFGNGQTSSIQNPNNIIFTNSGNTDSIYQVKLIVSAGSGCKDSITKSITVKPLPNPSFTQTTDTVCFPSSFSVVNTSTQTPPIVSYQWKSFPSSGVVIINDTSSTSTNILLPDNKTGGYVNYNIYQVSYSNFGCKDSFIRVIKSATRPLISFNLSPDSSCGPQTIQTHNNTLYAKSYNWSTGNQNLTISNSTDSNPTINVPENKGLTDSIYYITLIATSSYGCKDTLTDSFLIHPKPRAKFLADSTNSCGPVLVSFTNQSIGNVALNYVWRFGDGASDTATNPKHTYQPSNTQDTTYFVTLIVTSAYGCVDSTTSSIIVKPGPTSRFLIADTLLCTHGTSVNLSIQNKSFGNVDTFIWNFGDGNTVVTTNSNTFNHSYSAEGIYKIQLEAKNECRSSYDSAIVTILEPPHISLSQSDTMTCNPIIYYQGFVSNVLNNRISYLWDFGNGVTSSKLIPDSVNYGINQTGKDTTYQISFKAWNSCDTVVVYDSVRIRTYPFAYITPIKQTGCSPFKAVFVNTTLGIDTSLSTDFYVWDFGDGTPRDTTKTKTNRLHTYIVGKTDTFYVKLWAYNKCGVDSQTHQMIVYPNSITPLVSILPANGQGCNPLTVKFTNNTTGANTFTWTFDSVNGTNSRNASWTFTKAGIYNVEMNAANACSDTSVFIKITVNDPPKAGFIDSGNYCEPSLIYFKNTTTNATSYLWDFGDGDTSIAVNPNHQYDSAGYYKVLLTTKNLDSTGQTCIDTISKFIQIFKKPIPNISYDKNTGCEPLVVNFSALNTKFASSYTWNFGNGSTSSNTNPQQTFITQGRDTSFTIKLIANNTNACVDSANVSITIFAKPKAIINITDTFECYPGNLSFTNNSSTNAAAAIWDFGDGTTSSVFNTVNHSYSKPGVYPVWLKVSTINSCIDSVKQNIKIGGNDSLKINAIDTVLCIGVKGTYQCPVSNAQHVDWDFGDGSYDTGLIVKHNWFNSGTYQLIMTMTGPDGCIDSAIKQIVVNTLPQVDFTINDSLQCVNEQVFNFTSTSSAGAGLSSYTWKWGDNSQNSYSAVQNTATHSYLSSGNYNIWLIARTNQGCEDSAKHSVVVYPKPNPQFSINDSDQCINKQNFVYNNSSSISSGSISYVWDFGDSQTGNTTNPSHTYVDTGLYNIKLLATSNFGCVDSIEHQLIVRPKPTIDFTLSDTTMCLNGNSFIITPTVSIPYGTLSLFWDFGDGNSSSVGGSTSSITHTYNTFGSYKIKLKVVSSFGCEDSIVKNVVVWPKPIMNLTVNDSIQCLNNQNFVFKNTSSISSGGLSFDWDFGDGNVSNNNSTQNVSHTYSNYGMYDIKLVAISNNGCKDSIINSIIVAPKPKVDFYIPGASQCVNLNNFTFVNLSTITGGTLSYHWKFGDGDSSLSQSPNHSYKTYGTFSVLLKVQSNFGCIDSFSNSVTVDPKPNMSFIINDSDQCLVGNQFNLTNKTSIASGSLLFDWDFDDGNVLLGDSNSNISHSYLTKGIYTVRLKAISDLGCIDSISKQLIVRGMPQALFIPNDSVQCINDQNIYFTNNSSIDFGGLKYDWDFGNNTSSNIQSPKVQYLNTGTYTIKLKVQSDYGCLDSTTNKVLINPKPRADYQMSDTSNCVSLLINFTDQSSNDVAKWLWDFDDPLSGLTNNSSTNAYPMHTYLQPGGYNPNLIVTNILGCSDTISYHVEVYPDPTANFSSSPKAACDTPITVVFTNSSMGAMAYLWDLGNGKTSTVQDPTAVYINNQTYQVILTAISDKGCRDSMVLPYIVAKEPRANYMTGPKEGCEPLAVTFTNNSTNNTQNYWEFGDGLGSTQTDPIHIYNKPGTFITMLTARNGNCFDTLVKDTVKVYPLPQAGFTYTENGNPPSGTIIFNNNSTGAISQVWDFGDGTQSFELNPTHRYYTYGDYRVMLIVSTSFGCYDTFEQMIHVDLMKGLFVPNAFTPDANQGDARVFKPSGVGIKEYHVRVFNTWGELLWESKELENSHPKDSWNGYWQGKPCKADVYVWKIEATFIDGSVWPGKLLENGTYSNMGTVTLIR